MVKRRVSMMVAWGVKFQEFRSALLSRLLPGIQQYSFYHSTEGGRLSRPRHCRKGAAACPRLHITVVVVISALTAVSHLQPGTHALGHCDLPGQEV